MAARHMAKVTSDKPNEVIGRSLLFALNQTLGQDYRVSEREEDGLSKTQTALKTQWSYPE